MGKAANREDPRLPGRREKGSLMRGTFCREEKGAAGRKTRLFRPAGLRGREEDDFGHIVQRARLFFALFFRNFVLHALFAVV